jgi:hypothetical protein
LFSGYICFGDQKLPTGPWLAGERVNGLPLPTMAFQIACGVWVIEIEK